MSGIPAPSHLRTPRASVGGRKSLGPGMTTPSATNLNASGIGAHRPVSRAASSKDKDERDREFEELMARQGGASTPQGQLMSGGSANTNTALGRSVARKASQLSSTSNADDELGTPLGPPKTPSATRSALATSMRAPKTPSATPSLRKSLAPSATPQPARANLAPPAVPQASSRPPKVGDAVFGAGMQGTLRFLGAIEGKAGVWAGVDLQDTEWHGKGKNDGTVAGKPYFDCPPLCGIFVPAGKIALISAAASQAPAPLSPPSRPSPLLSRSTSTAASSRPVSSLATSVRQAPKSSAEAAKLAQARITEGSRASRYIGMTAAQLAARASLAQSTRAGRPASPEKPSAVGSPSKIGGVSPSAREGTMSPTRAQATPRAASTASRARPRASLGPPLTGRKSIGPGAMPPPSSTVMQTPTAAGRRTTMGPSQIASSMVTPGRPGSSLAAGRRTSGLPEVPPLPTEYRSESRVGLDRSVSRLGQSVSSSTYSRPESRSTMSMSTRDREGASSVLGDRTPSAAGARRRQSMAPPTSVRDREGAISPTPGGDRRPESALSFSQSASGRQSVLSVDRFVTEERAEREKELRDAKGRVDELERQVRALEEAKERAEKERAERDIAEETSRKEQEEVKRELDQARQKLAAQGEVDKLKQEHEDFVKTALTREEALASATSDLAALRSEQALWVEERSELTSQLDELRTAGQALCEVYEEKISFANSGRQAAEESLSRLESEIKVLQATVQERGDDHAHERVIVNEAAAIDNESLRADLKHARDRMSELQEQLDEARSNLALIVEKSESKVQEQGDAYGKMKDEARRFRDELAAAGKEKAALKQNLVDLERTLVENRRAQEEERLELEALRQEAVVAQEVGILRTKLDQATSAKEQLQKAVEELKEREKALQEELDLVGEIKAAEAEDEQLRIAEVAKLNEQLQAKEAEIVSLRKQQSRLMTQTAPTNMDSGTTTPLKSLSPARLGDVAADAAAAKGRRDSTMSISSNGTSRRSAVMGSPMLGMDDPGTMRDQIVGLKAIVQQMTDERTELESGNKKSLAEIQELRHVKVSLETTVQRLMAANGGDMPSDVSIPTRSKAATDRLEEEVESLKTRLSDVERKHSREVKALNKEVSELESLIEAKIFHEDELESELARYKALAQGGHSRRATVDLDTPESKRIPPSRTPNGHAALAESERHSKTSSGGLTDDDACELCGQPHRLEDCEIFAGSPNLDAGRAWRCANCESDDHTTEECEHSDEVF